MNFDFSVWRPLVSFNSQTERNVNDSPAVPDGARCCCCYYCEFGKKPPMMKTEATKRDCQVGEQRDRQGDMMSGHQQGDSNYLGSFSNIIPSWYIVPNQTNYNFQNTTTTYPMDVPAGFWGRETVLMTPNGTIYLEEFKEVKNCRFIKCHLLTVWVGGGMFIFLKENSQLYKSWDIFSVCEKADNLLHLFRHNRLKISDDFEMTGCFPAMEVTDLIYKPPPEDSAVF